MPLSPFLIQDQDVLRATVTGQTITEGQKIINRFHFLATKVGVGIPTTYATFGGDFLTHYNNAIAVHFNADYGSYDIKIEKVDSVDALAPTPKVKHPVRANITKGWSSNVDTSFVGTHSGASLPNFVAWPVLLRTGFNGKWWRSTMHFGPYSEDQTTTPGDKWTAGAVTEIEADLATLFSYISYGAGGNTLTMVPVIFSAVYCAWHLPPGSPPADATATILTQTPAPRPGSMNSRKAPVRSLGS